MTKKQKIKQEIKNDNIFKSVSRTDLSELMMLLFFIISCAIFHFYFPFPIDMEYGEVVIVWFFILLIMCGIGCLIDNSNLRIKFICGRRSYKEYLYLKSKFYKDCPEYLRRNK